MESSNYIPRRGDKVALWLRKCRAGYLEDYRLHADTGKALDEEVE